MSTSLIAQTSHLHVQAKRLGRFRIMVFWLTHGRGARNVLKALSSPHGQEMKQVCETLHVHINGY